MATTNIQSFAGDVEVTGELTVTGQLNSITGSDKVKLTATTTDETDYIPLSRGTAGAQPLYTDSNLTYNPANNVIGANISGNASFATSATHANAANAVKFTNRDSSNNTDYIAFVDTHAEGDKALFTDQNLTYNSSTNQIGANVSGNVSGTNVSATTLHYPTQTIQPVINGGGTVTYNSSKRILWSERVIAIPIERDEMGASGYIDIECPVSGTITYFSGSSGSTTATCTADGVPMGSWQALYYVVTPGQAVATDQTRFRLINYSNTTWNPDSNWILICVRNGDNNQLKWLPGQTILAPGQEYNSATRGTYGAVFADSATNATFATSATHANAANAVKFSDRDSSNNTDYIAFVDTHTAGDKALYTDQNLTYNSSTNAINANVPYANNAGTLDGASKDKSANASSIAQRDNSGDLNVRLVRPNYSNQNYINGAMAFRTNASNDNYIRFCSSASAIRNFIDCPGWDNTGIIMGSAFARRNSQYSTYSGNFVTVLNLSHTPVKGSKGHQYILFAAFDSSQPGSGYDVSGFCIREGNTIYMEQTEHANRGGDSTVITYSNYSTTNSTRNFSAAARRVSTDDVLNVSRVNFVIQQRKS